MPRLAATSDGTAAGAAAAGADAELPLWRFLRQQGFSEQGISRMRSSRPSHLKVDGRQHSGVTGKRFSEEKLQRDLAPNIAALRAEGLDTAAIEGLYQQQPGLLTTTHATLSSSMAALRQLVALLPDDPRAVQAPPGATQLGVALWLYPTTALQLLVRTNLGSLIEGNLRLRRQLGASEAATAAALFKDRAGLLFTMARGEAMVAHLQRLQAEGALSQEQVSRLALSAALNLTPTQFDQRWFEGGLQRAGCLGANYIGLRDPAGRQRAAAEALGELLQAADGMPGPLQQQYQEQGAALVAGCHSLWASAPGALRASWSALQRLGLSSSQLAAIVMMQPAVLAYNWEGEAKLRLLAWVEEALGLNPFDFLLQHSCYATSSVITIAMRADFVRQYRPAVWLDVAPRGTGPLLSLLTHRRFYDRCSCTAAELDAFKRAWLATPAGRRWGGKLRRSQRRTPKGSP